ncbi:calmin [Mugil cephalus]|uniref:calmin n=1 Tax=Mugil cephalus TaxID=48193 RepID=UPI001FB67C3C|nr:calmin [Mugil cephalus]
MAGHEWEDWFEREEFIGQISDIRVQNLQVEREMVQKRTFTRWMNLHLEKCDPPMEVHDLFQDIQDGHILMALLEELSGCKLLHGFKKSSHRIFRLNNIAKVLSFLEERNVKLVSIDAVDVADGNSSIILGLIWNIILFFQIKELTGNIRSQFPSTSSLSSIPTSSDSDVSYCSTPSDERQSASTAMQEQGKAIKKLLQWVQKRTRKYGVAVQDFGKSWTSGLAFLAVIKSIDPSLVDMRKALLRSARENLEDAFRIAHYSLGIPRLLEPEDVTINAPDEQSIMMYVSQFLEHFPGIQEPEEPCKLIERSISMGRLNLHESDFDYIRNGVHRSRVKERSYMFQRDCAKLPPKILISSISEDRSIMSPPFRVAASRSWSSEDFLADSPHMDSSSVHENPNKPSSKALPNLISDSPHLSDTHSLTGSSVTESVNTDSLLGDSAISSPDSWIQSDTGLMHDRYCESRSDSSLGDSGAGWDIYHATPVEVTTFDEGCIPLIEDRTPEEQSMTESSIDEGIYSLSSLESTQGKLKESSEKKIAEVVKEEETIHNQNLAVDQVPDQSETEIIKEVDFELTDTTVLQKENVPPSSVADALKQNSVEESNNKSNDTDLECLKQSVDFIGAAMDNDNQINGQTQSLTTRNNFEEVEEETDWQKTDSSLQNKREDLRNELLKENNEGAVETQGEESDRLLSDDPDSQESKGLENEHSINQERSSKITLDPIIGMNIPLISISSVPEEQDEEGICGPEEHGPAEYQDPDLQRVLGSQQASTDVNRSQTSDESSSVYSEDDNISVEIPSCLVLENVKPTTAEEMRDLKNEHNISQSTNADTCGPGPRCNMEINQAKQECHDDSQAEKDLIAQSPCTNTETELVMTEEVLDSTHPFDGHQDTRMDTSSENEKTNAHYNTPDPSDDKLVGNGIPNNEPASVSTNMNVFYADFGRHSCTEDLIGDLIEPMDLFYPDKEEPMFTDPPDTEMQRWPSVLSVSALLPAPPSETMPDDQQLNMPAADFSNKADMLPERDKLIVVSKTNQDTDNTSESQKQCFLPEGPLSGDVLTNNSDLCETEQQNAVTARENNESLCIATRSYNRQDKNQIPPVLRHRKGAHLTESMDNQRAAFRKADNDDSDFGWNESWELYLLLLLWLLLYCFWLLPQMDLKTLPSLLLNLDR